MDILNNNDLVSVIIPVYNRENTISRAIQSVLNQTYQNFEIIIVDDFSSDETVNTVRKLMENDNRIQLLLNNKNRGANYSRNRGIKYSKGKFIALLDSDDQWLKPKLLKQLNLFYKHIDDKLGVVYCGAIYIDQNSKGYYQLPYKEGNILIDLLSRNYIIAGGSNCLIKKKVFNECGLFDESKKMYNKQDYEMWLRIAKKYEFNYVRDYLVKIYFSEGISFEKSFGFPIKGVISSLYIIKKHKDVYFKNPKGLSDHLKYIGLQYIWAKFPIKAIKFFKLSIICYPKNVTSFLFLYLSFLGKYLSRKLSLAIHKLYTRFYS
jgi:glycosyltransferase involved in cell wall biosynthesis